MSTQQIIILAFAGIGLLGALAIISVAWRRSDDEGVVGRLDRRTSEVQMVSRDEHAPFPGPWSLKAVVRDRGPELRIVR